MSKKRNSDVEDHKMSKWKMLLGYLVIVTLIVSVLYKPTDVILAIMLSFVCIIFLFLMNESSSLGLLKKLEIQLFKNVFFKLERGEKFSSEEEEKLPSDMTIVIPKSEKLEISNTTGKLLAEGEYKFKEGDYKLASNIYSQVSRKDNGYWFARVNEMLSEVRLKNYDVALLIFEDIIQNCEENEYLAQAYINKGDCIMSKSVSCSSQELEKEACDSYQKAHQIDPNSIASIYHYWFAETVQGNQSNAQVLSHLIEKHENNYLLNAEQIRYFKKYRETKKIELITEELIMNWKKMILTGVFTIFLSVILLAGEGVLNGGT